jgi:hypothetical protein
MNVKQHLHETTVPAFADTPEPEHYSYQRFEVSLQ